MLCYTPVFFSKMSVNVRIPSTQPTISILGISLTHSFFNVIYLQLTGVRAYSLSADYPAGRFVSVPTHHQRIGRDRLSIPNMSSFFWYPKRVRRYLSRDLYREDSFQANYVIYYTCDRKAYEDPLEAVEKRLFERWYGEIVVFRKGKGGGDVVSLNQRRGDTDRIIWKVIEKYGLYVRDGIVFVSCINLPSRFITNYR